MVRGFVGNGRIVRLTESWRLANTFLIMSKSDFKDEIAKQLANEMFLHMRDRIMDLMINSGEYESSDDDDWCDDVDYVIEQSVERFNKIKTWDIYDKINGIKRTI